jgi:hypothetical protein
MAGLIVLAWVSLWVWGQSPYDRYISHDHGRGVGFFDGLGVKALRGELTLRGVDELAAGVGLSLGASGGDSHTASI